MYSKKQTGFTIVELLIVIVVIGILAAITIVAYNGIQSKAYDTAVQSDLRAVGSQIALYHAENGVHPKGTPNLNTIDFKITQSAYGNHMVSGSTFYNLLYCWPTAANPESFALIAASRSGKVYEFKTSVREVSYSFSGGSVSICASAGNAMDTGSERDFFYNSSSWMGYAS